MAQIRLAIIGTAGRKEPITHEHWQLMLTQAAATIDDLEAAGQQVTALVSGGAAGADHVAVRLFLRAPQRRALILELAAAWDFNHNVYVESDSGNWQTNPGRTLNRHLRNFQSTAFLDPFEDIGAALKHHNCQYRVHQSGLLGRNTFVAEADVVLAMTFGGGRQIAQGGTADTCRKYQARGGQQIYHLDLNTGIVHSSAIVPSERKMQATANQENLWS